MGTQYSPHILFFEKDSPFEEETGIDDTLLGRIDSERQRDKHFTIGVREGISAGSQSTVQDGFDCGYKKAFLASCKFGKLRGVLNALHSYIVLNKKTGNKENDSCEQEIDNLMDNLDKIEKQMWKVKFNNIPPEEVKDAPSIHNFDHQQLLAVTDNSEFEKLLFECSHICQKLGLGNNILMWRQAAFSQ